MLYGKRRVIACVLCIERCGWAMKRRRGWILRRQNLLGLRSPSPSACARTG